MVIKWLLIGILFGWLTPRPAYLGPIEEAIWQPIKKKIPPRYRFWG